MKLVSLPGLPSNFDDAILCILSNYLVDVWRGGEREQGNLRE
jgi:hypothetical protein